MTQVDIEKLILENGFKLEDKQGHITYEFGTGDIYRISQLLFKKMNYIPCCTTLKDKQEPNFLNWLVVNGFTHYRDDIFINKDKQTYFEDRLIQMFNEEVMSL